MKTPIRPISFHEPDGLLKDTRKKLDAIRSAIAEEYCRPDSHPWIVAYSGGKDSTLLLQMVFEMLLALKADDRKRQIHIIANDTLVESPLVIEHLHKSLAEIRRAIDSLGLPMAAVLTKPSIDQTFWVNVIGRGYIPPTRSFRWCTDRLKIRPTNEHIEQLARIYGRVVLLIGTRKSESINRRHNIERREAESQATGSGRFNPHTSIKNCDMFAPIVNLVDDEVWTVLLQSRPPWGGTHRNLITLYRNARGGGECPLVLSKEDAPSCGTTSPRFGCWTCTVVNKDRSLGGLIDAGFEQFEPLMDFRDMILRLRENPNSRMKTRRNGQAKYRNGNPVLGPFILGVRRAIFRRLRDLQEEVGRELISNPEIEIIREIWAEDKVEEMAEHKTMEKLKLFGISACESSPIRFMWERQKPQLEAA